MQRALRAKIIFCPPTQSILVTPLISISLVMLVYMHERGLGKAMFGTVIGGGRVKQKSLFVATVDPLNILELPVDDDIIDPLNPDDDIGVTTFIVEAKQGLFL